MNVIAHITPNEAPFWIAVLAAGMGLGVALTVAVLGRIGRKDDR
jgi:hypothetical protein